MNYERELKKFFGNGVFEWQLSKKYKELWEKIHYDEEKYWGGFPKKLPENWSFPSWAIGPFTKYERNPVFAPSENGWDRGHFGGGVHNGAVIKKDGKLYYIYRGEQELPFKNKDEYKNCEVDYICDIGLAYSNDGVHFERDTDNSPFFRKGEDEKYSFEDPCVVSYKGKYYLFCNRWDWLNPTNPHISGAFLAISKDLIHWDKVGLIFPEANVIHRNPVVVQNPDNEAVKIDGMFIMYLNNGLIAYSDDLIYWKSHKVKELWPGGEGCFAVTDYSKEHADKIVLFTGGHHSGHFYAIGEVLFSKENPESPVDWLPRPVLYAEPKYPWENGLSAEPPFRPVSYWRDTVFFTGMTKYKDNWYLYYGGSEYYTCLAIAPFKP